MSDYTAPIDQLVHDLKERAKELNCLYQIQELLGAPGITIDDICQGIINVLPPGWQYPDVCQAKITFANKVYKTPGFKQSPWVQSADIIVQDETVGRISVYYTEDRPPSDEGPFLKEERKLIDTIAEQFGFYILHLQLRQLFQEQQKSEEDRKQKWGVILDLLKRTDPDLLVRISRKMINYLSWMGVKEAGNVLERSGHIFFEEDELLDANQPYKTGGASNTLAVCDEIFAIAGKHLSQDVILNNIQKWIKEDRSGFLVDVLVNPGSSMVEISSAIERYHLLSPQGIELTAPREKWFRINLIRRILSDQPAFLEVSKKYIDIDDFSKFMHRVIFPAVSHGKLGGKSCGLYLAEQILKKTPRGDDFFQDIKTPKTWYLTSDSVFYFMTYNNLEDFVEQKYKDLNQVRQEYPYVINVFKNSPLPPEIYRGLSLALEDLGDVPLIVRSSSLLEDQTGAAFAGKYKSLFIANKGAKEERLRALIDAVVEVYASLFSPDPVEYRYDHRLIDQHEEMGILIQEVVGTQVGPYFFPAFAGVAFSQNDFRWSSRIERDDNLVRLVPGLGTRAVDRLSDDYPVLVVPGKPRLRVNVSLDEIIRYSPKKIDVINLETRNFETIEIRKLLKEYGQEYPLVKQLVSILYEDRLQAPPARGINFENDNFVITFEGLFLHSPFLKQVREILGVLQEALNHPVDIEFAHDGKNFYLLQCRAQSYSEENVPAAIPKEFPLEKTIFSAKRYITNGNITDIRYIVYIDPAKYSELANQQDMIAIGRAVGRLNQMLPKRQYILMGPGRWGSRGDIHLGVNVTYSDISNTAMLIEIARKQKDYIPDPSFGTHFFQDLVEASIRYLPLYPDDPCILFREEYLTGKTNQLSAILPDFAYLSEVIRVIDVPASSNGQILQILMNAETEEAVAILTDPKEVIELERKKLQSSFEGGKTDAHWRWRLQMVEAIAARLDPERFGVQAMYVFGSTKNAEAGPESDIDLLIHFRGADQQRKELAIWLEGWSLSLSHANYLRTGYRTNGLLDVHIVSDEEVESRNSFASKIGAVSDAARPLALGTLLNKA